MRQISGAALAYLASGAPCFPADLFTLTLIGGSPVYRWTSTDIPISYGGNTWIAQSPNLHRSSISVRNTVEVPELKIILSALDDDFVGGSNIKQQCHEGALDGARLKLERLPMPTPGNTSLGPPTLMFDGRVGQVQITATGAEILVKGDVVVMNQYAPHNVFQASCQWTFCDHGCTLSAASFTSSFTVGSGPSISFLPWTAAPGTPANFVLGKVTMTSGINNGEQRTIRAAGPTGVIVSYPFFNVANPGDTFTALQGCNKLLSGGTQSCTSYANTQHFRGFPYVPQPEYSI
jgi:uncharacterized phage protein (TIGR02218 family)